MQDQEKVETPEQSGTLDNLGSHQNSETTGDEITRRGQVTVMGEPDARKKYSNRVCVHHQGLPERVHPIRPEIHLNDFGFFLESIGRFEFDFRRCEFF